MGDSIGEQHQSNVKTDNLEDDWQTDSDVDEDILYEESQSTTISTCSSPTPRNSPKHTSRLQNHQNKKHSKKIKNSAGTKNTKLKNANDSVKIEKSSPQIGDELLTEALVVNSTATVVWQDGTVESGIPSVQLYPIHHLDDHVNSS